MTEIDKKSIIINKLCDLLVDKVTAANIVNADVKDLQTIEESLHECISLIELSVKENSK